jgi:hypothetical protein
MSYLNPNYTTNIIAQINNVPDCQTLETLITNEIQVYFQSLLSSVQNDISKLLPLKSVPTNLSEVISWITTYINLVNNQYTKLVATEAEIIVAYGQIITAITNKIASMSCTFSPPPPL